MSAAPNVTAFGTGMRSLRITMSEENGMATCVTSPARSRRNGCFVVTRARQPVHAICFATAKALSSIASLMSGSAGAVSPGLRNTMKSLCVWRTLLLGHDARPWITISVDVGDARQAPGGGAEGLAPLPCGYRSFGPSRGVTWRRQAGQYHLAREPAEIPKSHSPRR